jgi:hypothetical protein
LVLQVKEVFKDQQVLLVKEEYKENKVYKDPQVLQVKEVFKDQQVLQVKVLEVLLVKMVYKV